MLWFSWLLVYQLFITSWPALLTGNCDTTDMPETDRPWWRWDNQQCMVPRPCIPRWREIWACGRPRDPIDYLRMSMCCLRAQGCFSLLKAFIPGWLVSSITCFAGSNCRRLQLASVHWKSWTVWSCWVSINHILCTVLVAPPSQYLPPAGLANAGGFPPVPWPRKHRLSGSGRHDAGWYECSKPNCTCGFLKDLVHGLYSFRGNSQPTGGNRVAIQANSCAFMFWVLSMVAVVCSFSHYWCWPPLLCWPHSDHSSLEGSLWFYPVLNEAVMTSTSLGLPRYTSAISWLLSSVSQMTDAGCLP